MSDSPDPRVVRSREAVLSAARALLREEGPTAVTHQRVAARAKVGRATVYRHWPRPDLLLTEAMDDLQLPFFRDPVTPVRPWLKQQLRVLADQLALPDIQAVSATLIQGGVFNPEITARRDLLAATMSAQLRSALVTAQDAGELRATVDLHDASAVLIGPLLYRGVLELRPVSHALIDHLVDAIGTWTDQ